QGQRPLRLSVGLADECLQRRIDAGVVLSSGGQRRDESLTLAFGHGGQYADTQLLGVGGAATSEQAGARASGLSHQLGQLGQVAEQAADKRISVRVGIEVQAGGANEILK